ncbi:MAG: cytochrome d ubiquinol oxidase subunit II [Elusimicrobia bacterium]|nr:cytochrome d ubiquinol oxidase subunit II [Elusimicrobiota bacterium]MBK7545733.1 cytochrome d ubiquinol oxidase subunit II [Elusimicrobiota bacterium]MBK7574996.1 cytochrome d ubiquinol oxidase subunit II [Elusimicrobiota bacterium]MBK8125343.1 cytochrome d ubiquinol oxidase subunit II [Elusimicrobiota bacterium]MBK8423973.1 cytochrome d ubiquinol oxidase subunit II [Elusimicrobiota bacterium]
MDLNIFWFVLLGVLMAGYAILDGFDLGVGILHPMAKTDQERRIFMNAIGPLWDGNEVWLVTFGGALFAAFPRAYATMFSGLYTAFMLLVLCLILRAVSMEFRSKRAGPAWRAFWDWCFFGSSLTAILLFGAAVGNCLRGLPIGSDGELRIGFLSLLNPYSVLVGVFTIATAAMHGSLYLGLKTDGDLQQRIRRWTWRLFGFFLITYLLTTIFTLVAFPRAVENFKHHPWAWGVVVLNTLAVANIPRSVFKNRPLEAFLSSAGAIAAFVFLFGLALFPNLAVSNLDPAASLTIYNAASSEKTLKIMRLIAFLGMPFVLAYTAVIYWVFRGKVEIGKFSY